MTTTINKIAILTSGGDAPGMNAAIRAIVLAAHHYGITPYGFSHGYNGLIENDITLLSPASVNGIIHRGGTILKSARCPEMMTEDGVNQATLTLLKEKIDALIVIGGDGSFSGLLAIQAQWQGKTIGIPGTIDNDLDGSDYTIGFATAVNTAIEAIDKIRDTADAFDRIFIVELMGRRSGHITFNAGMACAAEHILSFENFSPENRQQKLVQLAQEIKNTQQNRHASYIIVLAENLWPGGASKLAEELNAHANIDSTACILGHIQRGGNPVAKDRILGTKMGVAAIQALMQGETEIMIGEKHNHMVHVQLSDAIQHEKRVDKHLIEAQDNILALTVQTQY
ncbi:ATP-dependent 6-phosphofructokinase [Colwelliaceae bacterium 6471]